MVQGDDAQWARSLLTPEIRARLVRLIRQHAISIDLGPPGITVRMGSASVEEPDVFEVFVLEAQWVAMALYRILEPPMVIVEMTTIPAGHCLVCGTPVVEGGCACRRCGTIHHLDCWKYFGGCALFACAGRPRRLRRVSPVTPPRNLS